MATIEYRPWKKIVVHDVAEIAPKEFFQGLVSAVEAQKQGASPIVFWIDGIAFVNQLMPDTERILSEKVDGILHFNAVQFTRTEFQAEKRVTVQGRDHIVKMVKADKNPDYVNLTKFLKDRPPLPTGQLPSASLS